MSLITQGGYYEWKVANGANEYTAQNIVGGTLTESLFSECSFGNVISKQLNLKLWNVAIDTSSPIVLSYKASNSSTWVAKGTYLVDTVSTSPYSEYTEVTAFDAILKAEAIYMKEGEWSTISAEDLVDEIAGIIGVEAAPSALRYIADMGITIDQAPSIGENGTTCRQILSTIGALCGGNFFITDSNRLMFKPLFASLMLLTNERLLLSWYNSVLPTGENNEVVTFDKSDAEYIVGIEFQANGGESFRYPNNLTDEQWEALNGRILYNNLPFMASQEAVDRVGALYVDGQSAPTGIPYIPYTANTYYATPNTELGAAAHIKDTIVQITNRTIDISPLASCDLSAETSRQAESYYPYISPQVREARQKAEENYAAITILPTQIMSEVYTKGETDERISSQVSQSADALTISFDEKLGTAVGEANAYTQEQTEGLRTYFTFGSDGLTIGKSGSPFKTEISNTELAFTGESGEKAAWINANQLNIQEAVIPADGDIQLKGSSGKWVQQVRNGHFQIRWVGN